MTSSPDPDESRTDPDAPIEPDERPLTRIADRFRVPLGILVALVGAFLAVVFAVRPLGDGARGLITQGAGVALWLCVIGVGVTWALDTSRKVTNGFALGGIACYAVFWLAGL